MFGLLCAKAGERSYGMARVGRDRLVLMSYISEIESDRKPGSAAAIRAVANALRIQMENLT